VRGGVKNDVFSLQIAPLATCSSALLVGPNSRFLSATSTVVGGVQSGHHFLCTVAQRKKSLSVWSASILGVDIIQIGVFGGVKNDAFCARNMRNTVCTRCKPSCTSGRMVGTSVVGYGFVPIANLAKKGHFARLQVCQWSGDSWLRELVHERRTRVLLGKWLL
jgi:hypothetical protein